MWYISLVCFLNQNEGNNKNHFLQRPMYDYDYRQLKYLNGYMGIYI